jgi:hypothetical protein
VLIVGILPLLLAALALFWNDIPVLPFRHCDRPRRQPLLPVVERLTISPIPSLGSGFLLTAKGLAQLLQWVHASPAA